MANVLASLEANAPMGKAKTTDEKIKAIEDYLVQLLEQFRWTLNNLSADNFNEKEVVSWLNSTITEPIQVAIQSAEEDMRTEIQASAEGVVIDVHKEYATAWVSGTAYKVNDVIKRESTNDVGFYKCRQDHTAANTNRPPTGADWATYWSVVQPEDVLHTRFDVNASEIRSEVSRATGAEGALSSAITQSANDIRLEVKGDYAKEWASGSSYYESDVVKVSTIVNDVVTAVNFYKAKSDHTAAAGNKPPNATYWESVSNATVQSMIDMSLNGITLSYDDNRIGYSEWAADVAYAKDSVVSVTSGGTSTFYKAKRDHTSSNSNQPPNATYWESTTNPNEHNGAFIKLTKDGTEIAGGKVFIKDLDASTIRTGTLDAGSVNLLEKFTVKAKAAQDDYRDCGYVGGKYKGNDKSVVIIESLDETNRVEIAGDHISLERDTRNTDGKYALVYLFPNEIDLEVRGANSARTEFVVDTDGIWFRQGTGAYNNLFDLL